MMIDKIHAYKAFDKDFKCRGFRYEVGKEYSIDGEPIPCNKGFHGCENPLDILDYYPMNDSRFAEVIIFGAVREGDKICGSTIKIVREIALRDLITKAVKYASLGSFTQYASSGHSTKNASSGNFTKNASSGNNTKNASSGDYTKNASSGGNTKNVSSGHETKNASSGHSTKNASSGGNTKNASSGYNTKNASSGDYTQNASSGNYTQTSIEGLYGITADIGDGSMVRGVNGTVVALGFYCLIGDKYIPKKIVAGVIGENGLKENVWYGLDSDGNFEERQND